MRVSVFILLILLVSCSAENKEDYRGYTKHTLQLVDSLGEIELMLPNYYDTLHSWIRYSDIRCGDMRNYRFQPSKYPMGQEKGELNDIDSISDCLTISHYDYLDCRRGVVFYRCDSLNMVAKVDTIIQFESNGITFCYSSHVQQMQKGPDNEIPDWYFEPVQISGAILFMDDLPIVLSFRKFNSEYAITNFDNECLKILKSMKITRKRVLSN
jgi:hypothetical protein